MNKKIIVSGVLFTVLLITIGGVIYLLIFKKPASQPIKDQTQVIQQKLAHGKCLNGDEIADYNRISLNPAITQPKETSPMIYVRNKTNGEVITNFQLDNVRDSGHPIGVHKCGIYFVREFNTNPKDPGRLQAGQRAELWKYDYQGQKNAYIVV